MSIGKPTRPQSSQVTGLAVTGAPSCHGQGHGHGSSYGTFFQKAKKRDSLARTAVACKTMSYRGWNGTDKAGIRRAQYITPDIPSPRVHQILSLGLDPGKSGYYLHCILPGDYHHTHHTGEFSSLVRSLVSEC